RRRGPGVRPRPRRVPPAEPGLGRAGAALARDRRLCGAGPARQRLVRRGGRPLRTRGAHVDRRLRHHDGGAAGDGYCRMSGRFGAYDVIVLGSGAAGLTAALSAAVAGATVAVYEKADLLGGTTALSGGTIWIPDNQPARRAGIADSRASALEY